MHVCLGKTNPLQNRVLFQEPNERVQQNVGKENHQIFLQLHLQAPPRESTLFFHKQKNEEMLDSLFTLFISVVNHYLTIYSLLSFPQSSSYEHQKAFARVIRYVSPKSSKIPKLHFRKDLGLSNPLKVSQKISKVVQHMTMNNNKCCQFGL